MKQLRRGILLTLYWGNMNNILTHCDCGEPFKQSTWIEIETYGDCDLCGDHSAVQCPKCNQIYDTIYNNFEEL